MKEAEMIARFLKGEKLLKVEYRSAQAEQIRWVDEKTGREKSAVMACHNIETLAPRLPLALNVELAAGQGPETIKEQFVPGTVCVLVFATVERVKGKFRARGVLEPLEK